MAKKRSPAVLRQRGENEGPAEGDAGQTPKPGNRQSKKTVRKRQPKPAKTAEDDKRVEGDKKAESKPTKTAKGNKAVEVDEKAERITGWFGLFSAVAGLLSKTDKLDGSSRNTIVCIMFSYLLVYVMHDIYDAINLQYEGDWFYSSWWWAVLLSVVATFSLVVWFGAYWLQRPFAPADTSPVLGQMASFIAIIICSSYIYIYCIYDMWDAYYFKYEGWEQAVRTAVISLVVVIVLGFLSYRPAPQRQALMASTQPAAQGTAGGAPGTVLARRGPARATQHRQRGMGMHSLALRACKITGAPTGAVRA